MFVSNKLLGLFHIAKDHVDDMKTELAALRVERDAQTRELASTKVMNDWLRMKVNQLEIERAQLLAKAYGIHTQVPEIVQRPNRQVSPLEAIDFDDMGDKKAQELGLPLYDLPSKTN